MHRSHHEGTIDQKEQEEPTRRTGPNRLPRQLEQDDERLEISDVVRRPSQLPRGKVSFAFFKKIDSKKCFMTRRDGRYSCQHQPEFNGFSTNLWSNHRLSISGDSTDGHCTRPLLPPLFYDTLVASCLTYRLHRVLAFHGNTYRPSFMTCRSGYDAITKTILTNHRNEENDLILLKNLLKGWSADGGPIGLR